MNVTIVLLSVMPLCWVWFCLMSLCSLSFWWVILMSNILMSVILMGLILIGVILMNNILVSVIVIIVIIIIVILMNAIQMSVILIGVTTLSFIIQWIFWRASLHRVSLCWMPFFQVSKYSKSWRHSTSSGVSGKGWSFWSVGFLRGIKKKIRPITKIFSFTLKMQNSNSDSTKEYLQLPLLVPNVIKLFTAVSHASS